MNTYNGVKIEMLTCSMCDEEKQSILFRKKSGAGFFKMCKACREREAAKKRTPGSSEPKKQTNNVKQDAVEMTHTQGQAILSRILGGDIVIDRERVSIPANIIVKKIPKSADLLRLLEV